MCGGCVCRWEGGGGAGGGRRRGLCGGGREGRGRDTAVDMDLGGGQGEEVIVSDTAVDLYGLSVYGCACNGLGVLFHGFSVCVCVVCVTSVLWKHHVICKRYNVLHLRAWTG